MKWRREQEWLREEESEGVKEVIRLQPEGQDMISDS